MSKVTLNNITGGYAAVDLLNENFDAIEAAFDNTLSRNGAVPNPMLADFDLNHKDILNGGEINAQLLVLNGQPVTPGTLNYNGVVKETQTSTSGQTVFNLTTITYSPLVNNLSVYVDGVYQNPSRYTETSATRVTFSEGLHLGAVVDFVVMSLNELSGTTDAANVTYQPAGSGAVATLVSTKLQETVSVKDFGAVGDGVTDDYAAFRAAMDFCRDSKRGLLFVPSGRYYISQELEFDFQGKIFGERGTLWAQDLSGTVLRFPAGTNGVRFCRANTSTSGGLGDDSILENLEIICVGDNKNSTGHGIVMDARGFCVDVSVQGFPEDGFHIEASATGSPSRNANLWSLIRCRSNSNGRDGLYVNGADANAGWALGLNCNSNGRINVFDSSFLGNTYVGAHSSSPGRRSYGRGSDGQAYRCKLNHTAAANTIPVTGADWATYWELWDPTTTYPDIVVGTKYYDSRAGSAGTYPIYHYLTDNLNAKNCFIGCYAEGASGAAGGGSRIIYPSAIFSGELGSVEPIANGYAIRPDVSKLSARSYATETGSDFVTSTLGGRNGTLGAFVFKASGPAVNWALDFDATNNIWRLRGNGSNSSQTFYICDSGNSLGMPAGLLDFSTMGFGLGGKRFTSGSAAPTTGTWARGDVVFDSSPTAGDYIGWVCVTGGTPGTWKQFGAILP